MSSRNIWFGHFFSNRKWQRSNNNCCIKSCKCSITRWYVAEESGGEKKDNLTRLENSCAGVNNKMTIVMRKFMSLFWTLISIAFTIGSHFLSFSPNSIEPPVKKKTTFLNFQVKHTFISFKWLRFLVDFPFQLWRIGYNCSNGSSQFFVSRTK